MTKIRTQFVTQVRSHSGAGVRFTWILGSLRVNSGPYTYRTDRQRDQHAPGSSCPSLFLFCLGSEGKAKMPCESVGQVRVILGYVTFY